MDRVLYYAAFTVIRILQMLPLLWVARIGRLGGGIAYWIDSRHRKVALTNLTLCFQKERSASELREIARENFRRIGENYACAAKTAILESPQLQSCFQIVGHEKLAFSITENHHSSHIVALGHFGNFELYGRCAQFADGTQPATTYRSLRQPLVNELMQSLRIRSGCLFFERRSGAKALCEALNTRKLLLGLLADQHGGDRGLWIPFLGQECSTNIAPAVLALRYKCPLFIAICFRLGLARWRVEVGDEIPTRLNGRPRTVEAISRDINTALEIAIRRDPANWFWVHKRWKPRRANSRGSAKTGFQAEIAEPAE